MKERSVYPGAASYPAAGSAISWVEVLNEGKKSSVYRGYQALGGQAIIVKRTRLEKALRERTKYAEILADRPVDSILLTGLELA